VIAFDAGVLIAYLDAGDQFHQRAKDFMEEYEEFEFAANVLTIAESLVRPVSAGRSSSVVATLDQLGLERIGLGAGDATAIAETRASSGLKMSDAVVLFTAERHGAELVTTDRSLARAAESRGIAVHSLLAETSD
jgi:predicted nucleic acid-binding protein